MTHSLRHADHKPSRKLDVLLVLEPSGGGSGRHFIDLARGLIDEGHSVTAIYSATRAEPGFIKELSELPLAASHEVAMRRIPHPTDIFALWAIQRIILKEGPFDIIHGHSSKAGLLTRLCFLGRKSAPVVYTPHAFRTMDPTLGKAESMVYGGVESLFGRVLSDKIICVSKDEYQHALDLGIAQDKLTTIVNGVSKPNTSKRQDIRTRFNLQPEDFVFGFVGRLARQKAPERLINAFARVSPLFPEARLMMIGFGELEEAMRALIDEHKLADRVILTHDVSGPEAMQAFDALVMPSRYEAMSYAMLEAGAAGKPMILSDVGGASTVVDSGKNGHIIENDDNPTELSVAMLDMARKDRATAFALEAFLREDRYGLDIMVSKTLSLYYSLLGIPHEGGADIDTPVSLPAAPPAVSAGSATKESEALTGTTKLKSA